MENKAPIEIPLLIVIATIGILVFIFFVVLFVLFYQKKALENKAARGEMEKLYQRQLLDATIQIAEAERKRIATNLHDDIGALINLVKLNIGKIERNITDIKTVRTLSDESSTLLENTMENIRTISRDLSPPVLTKLGFVEGLKDLCLRISHSGAVKIIFSGSVESPKFDVKTELQLYRIVQEVINNVLKHSGATEMNVKLNLLSNKYIILIVHNGKGINNDTIKKLSEESSGLGLKSIQSRSQMIGASLNYSSHNQESSIVIETLLHEKNV